MRNKRYSQVAAGDQQADPVCQRLHRRAASQVGMFYGRMEQRGGAGISGEAAA